MLTGNTLIAYNNLASFPPTPKLGDLLNAMGAPNPAYVGLTTPVEIDIYVASTGSDTDGDGSSTSPYRSVDRAISDFVSADLPATSVVNIYCGAGDFAVPVLGRFIPTNILVTVFGDLSNPVYEGPAEVSSLVAGYQALHEVDIGAYADVITDDSHWILVNFQDDFPGYSAYAAPCAASTSPNVRYVNNYDATVFSTFGIYPYATRFVDVNGVCAGNVPATGADGTSGSLESDPSYGAFGLKIIGVEFVVGDDFRFSNTNLQGCLVGSAGLGTDVRVLDSVVSARLLDINVFATDSTLIACLTSFSTLFIPQNCFISSCVEIGPGSTWSPRGYADIEFVDFRIPGETALLPYAGTTVDLYALSLEGDSLFDTEGQPNCSIVASSTVAGRINGTATGAFAARLRQGSQGFNLENACGSTLANGSTPGADIVVGQNSVATWASLPANDHSPSASAQWCRAS